MYMYTCIHVGGSDLEMNVYYWETIHNIINITMFI